MTARACHSLPWAAQPRAARGFTLIELLVAVALMAIVSIIAWRGLDSITTLRERLADDAEQTDRLLRMLGQLERDVALRAPDAVLEAALAPPLPDAAATPPHVLPLALEVSGAQRADAAARLEIVRAAAAADGTWQRVVWWREGNSLRRAAGMPSAAYPLPEPGAGIEVMPGVSAFTLRGWVPQRGWETLPQPPGNTTPLTGIEITVQRAGAGGAAEAYHRVIPFQ